MILHVPGILSKNQVQQIREIISQAEWKDGSITAGTQSTQVKKNYQLDEGSREAKVVREIILQALAVNATFLTGALPKKIYPPLFNKYEGSSNYFGNHIDNSVRTHAESGRHVRTDISCTLFLTDPDEYEGGELVIEDTFGTQSIKLEAGHMIMYPSSSIHRVNPVSKGARFASFFWIESMVRADDQRKLLYDLDMTIVALRKAYGDSEESIQLTGTYHNLLRMWADV